MSSKARSRRDVLRGGLHLALAFPVVAACKKAAAPFTCVDVVALAPEEASARSTLAYVEPAADGARACTACQQYVPASAEGACGTCKVLKGPVHPGGTCKVFTAKST